MSAPLVTLQGVNLRLGGRPVIQDVSLELNPGRITTLIGPNGSGKSTLIRLLLGLLQPDSGKVQRQPSLRIGYMPQKLHVDATLPLTVRRFMQLPRRMDKTALREALAMVNADHLMESPLQSLSGGETQRVLLARALLRRPQLLVLDEPVQGVDINGQIELYRLIGEIRARYGCAVFMVSHDLHLVMASTDTVICLNHHICCSGHPEQVSHDPAFVELFGLEGARSLALYSHQHNHDHDAHGNVISDRPQAPAGCRHG
ncbi:zinc ABC transporter ATP-binding protein ZnuC [Motiliproteus sp. SC1-56]|uniref:zinc ABC transporter ATP-binding protein ZnuC n=1 Tax=Motiliproteus sp. SC1-56 TaxID=2799565 RepID=UPI001A90A8B8|nr:zinc ABC transporter ATP-binding protein ZnuC [Motiliproteus sp. SC1-56]